MNQTEYFTEKIATLPEDVQEAIYESDYTKTLSEIQKEFKLHIDQGQILETLAIQLMFGDIDAPGFINGMFNEAHLSSAVAGDILLKIDLLILKRIRTYIEDMEEVRQKDAEHERILMEDEELILEDEASIYANYYADTAQIIQDTEDELIREGINPDGSNITDEMLARELGVTVEELGKGGQIGALKEAREIGSSQSFTQSLITEKEEMMQELESPEKSFSKPLFTMKEMIKEIPPDHQLQNVHIEIPYVDEIVHEHPPITITETPPPVVPVVEKPKPPVNPTTETMKKPTKITLSIDPYKEPIE